MHIITVSNHKGGVSKSTSTRILGDVLANSGQRVLLVDTDPQASLTGACGVSDASDGNLAHVLGGAEPGTLVLGDILFEISERLWLVPADIQLAVTELQLVARRGRERILARALQSMTPHFDIVLIDTPPSLGLLTVNALTAADAVIVPTIPEILALRGLRLFLDTLDDVRADLNPDLRLLGVLVTMANLRTIHHADALQAIQDAGWPVFKTVIGRSVAVAEAAINGDAVTTYAPNNPRAEEYRQLAKEVIQCLDQNEHA